MNQHQFPAEMIKKLPTYCPTRGRKKRNKHPTNAHRLRKEPLFQKGLQNSKLNHIMAL